MKRLLKLLGVAAVAVGISVGAMAQVGFQTQGFQTHQTKPIGNLLATNLYLLLSKPIELRSGKTSVTVALEFQGKIANPASANTATLTWVGQTSLDGNVWMNRVSVNAALTTNQASGYFALASTNLDLSTNRFFRWYSVSNSLSGADNVAYTNGQGVVTQLSVTNASATFGC